MVEVLSTSTSDRLCKMKKLKIKAKNLHEHVLLLQLLHLKADEVRAPARKNTTHQEFSLKNI